MSHATGQVTPEEVKAMSDEELRINVAKLHGLRSVGRLSQLGEIHLQYSDANGYRHELPDYPHDLNAALTLVDLMADKGWIVQLDNGLDKTWECTFEIGTSGYKDFQQIYVPADTLARAICEAVAIAMSPDEKSKRVTSVSKENYE